MFDQLVLDRTPASSPPFFQEYKERPRTPLSERGKVQSNNQTAFSSEKFLFARPGYYTPTLDDLRQRPNESLFTDSFERSEFDPSSSMKKARVSLLVKKYVGSASKEDSARLDILTARIRNLAPRVSTEEIETLSSIVDKLESSSALLADLRQRYDID